MAGLFYNRPRHPKLAKIITFTSVAAAKKAANELVRLFHKAKTREYKRAIKSATVLAANRAMASARRRDISAREKAKLRRVAVIYYDAAAKMVIKAKKGRR